MSNKFNCSMQKKIESLAKKSEATNASHYKDDYYVVVFTSNEDAVKGAEYARNFGEDPLLPQGGKAVYVYGTDRDALKAFGKKWYDTCVDNDLGVTSTFGLNKKDESNKSEALEDESDEVKAMVKELAEETGNNYEDAAIESYAPGKGICVTFGDEEYYCYEDYSDAEEASTESVKDLLETEGVDFIHFENIGGIEQFLDVDWFETALRECAESYISDIKSEPGRYEDEFGDLDEEDAIDKYVDEAGDAIEWFKMEFGEDYFNKTVMDNGLVDLDALAAACTEADGPANELARYDGKEIELPCGYYCYRSN